MHSGWWLLVLLVACSRGPEPPPTTQVGAARLRVRVAKVQERTLSGTRSFPGVLQPWEHATLGARVAGHLATIRVDRGSKVKKGETLAKISIPGLTESQLHADAQLKSAEADLSLARDMESRATKVATANPEAIAAAEVAALSEKAHAATARADAARAEKERARAQLDDATLQAPFDGVVLARLADPGAVLAVGAKVLEIAALDPLRLAIDVPERDASRLRVGQPADVLLPTAGDRRVQAKVARFAAALDPATHTLRAEIDVPNHDGSIVSGLEARTSVDFGAHSGLTIPSEAVIVEGGGAAVFVAVGGRAQRRSITVTNDDGRDAEIGSGLKAGEEVLLSARGLVQDGTAIEVAR